jgi:hypothetical protein
MEPLGMDIPLWVLDWTGSALVVVSLIYLFEKRTSYWHWSNASLLPYFALFVSGDQLMLAGLQLSYLIFGLQGSGCGGWNAGETSPAPASTSASGTSSDGSEVSRSSATR